MRKRREVREDRKREAEKKKLYINKFLLICNYAGVYEREAKTGSAGGAGGQGAS